jgi:hypothetical protein
VLCENDIDELIAKAYQWVDSRDELKNPDRHVSRDIEGEQEEHVECRSFIFNRSYQGEAADYHLGIVESRLEYEEYRKHCFAETLSELQLDDSRKMGYVYKCLATAILCLRHAMRQESSGPTPGNSEIFEGLITRLVMEGGDAVSEVHR